MHPHVSACVRLCPHVSAVSVCQINVRVLSTVMFNEPEISQPMVNSSMGEKRGGVYVVKKNS